MRLLLDTHVFLWAVTANRRLKSSTREFLSRADAVYVSAASIWEIAIKAQLGKIEADAAFLVDAIDSSGFQELPVSAHHAAAAPSCRRITAIRSTASCWLKPFWNPYGS